MEITFLGGTGTVTGSKYLGIRDRFGRSCPVPEHRQRALLG